MSGSRVPSRLRFGPLSTNTFKLLAPASGVEFLLMRRRYSMGRVGCNGGVWSDRSTAAGPSVLQFVAVQGQPLDRNDADRVSDLAVLGPGERLGRGKGEHTDVLALLRHPIDAADPGRVDPGAVNLHRLGGAARRRRDMRDRDQIGHLDAGFLARFADRRGLGRLARVDDSG